MKFDARILDYQRIDQDLIALETEVGKSKERQNLVAAKAKLDEATSQITKLSGEANEIFTQYAEYTDKLGALKAKLAEFDGIVDGIEDVAEAEYYLRQIDGILSEMSTLEKEINKNASRSEAVYQDFAKTWNAGMHASEVFKQATKEYNDYMAKLQPEVQKIQAELATLKKEIPEEFLKMYVTLRNMKKTPPFVEYDKENASCGRCRMDVPNDTKEKLRASGDWAECPNCRRILYIL